MYREESVSSAFSSVNGKSRGALDRKVRVDGVTLREKLRTKDGKITKAKAQMRKSASALSPEALYFFRDEMEKSGEADGEDNGDSEACESCGMSSMASSSDFVKVANLTDKQKSAFRNYWQNIWPSEFIDAVLDKDQ